MNTSNESPQKNWALALVSTVAVSSVIGLFVFVVDVSESISAIQSGQAEVNNAIVTRLENIEDGLSRFADVQEERYKTLIADVNTRTEGRYDQGQAALDNTVISQAQTIKDLELKIWILENYTKTGGPNGKTD